MEKQLRLFSVSEIKLHRLPLYYVEIIEDDGSKFILWIRRKIYSIAQAKKVAAIMYNKQRKYNPEILVKFGEIKKMN
jgi:hypothetical protein